MIRTSTEWINSLLETDLSDDDIIEALEAAGIEVEGIERVGDFDDHFIVGKIEEVRSHPNADRLKLAKVHDGTQHRQIVCGADNIKAGDIVPLALPGAVMSDDMKIKETKIRQEKSEGMLCSARELNVGHDHSGIFILDEHVQAGTLLTEVIDSNTVLELTTAANRADLQSVWGLAREVSAQKNIGTTDYNAESSGSDSDALFEIEATDKVNAYSLVSLQINSPPLAESPRWMQQRLITAGVQPKGLLIDATNYVMLETGQPLHAFDKNGIKDRIVVRRAKEEESITTIDGSKLQLDTNDLVIADTENPVALAGVMGGKESEVGPSTSEILLEGACFDGSSVRLSALRHHMRTDASARFERGLQTAFVDAGINYLLKLLEKHADVEIITQQHWKNKSKEQQKVDITLKVSDYERIIGHSITNEEMEQFLQRIGASCTKKKDTFIVQPPWWRSDLKLKEDIVEELMKLKGLEYVSAEIPHWNPDEQSGRGVHYFEFEKSLRSLCIGAGLSEVVTYSFIGEDDHPLLINEMKQLPKLLNPRSAEQDYLRSSLLPSLVNTLNQNRMKADRLAFFEISNVFNIKDEDIEEERKLGIVIRKPQSIYDCKGVIDLIADHFNLDLHIEMKDIAAPLTSSAQAVIRLDDVVVGVIGELRQDIIVNYKLEDEVGYVELDLEQLSEHVKPVLFSPLATLQTSFRDITILVKEDTLWNSIKNTLNSLQGTNATFSDEYRDEEKYGADKKAVTIHIELSHQDKTLNEKEIGDKVAVIEQKLQNKYDAKII